MPSISSWMRTKAQILFDHPDTGSTEYSTASFSPENEIALFCHCHPDEKQYHPNFLCEACRRFVKTCHWVQNYKLPSAQFSKLSKRQWKRGAYVADGDAVEGLNWDYEYSLSDRSVGCHLCELIGTLWEGTGSDLGYTDAWPSSRIKLSVYYDTHDKGHARLRVSACDDVDPGAYASLKLYHEWISDARKNSGTDEAFAQIGKCTGSNANFTLAKEWIETCREGHLTCNGHRPPVGPFPTRLVDVGTKSHDPHIYEVEIDKQIPEYITLSHCWGGLSPLTLTTATLEDFKSHIPFSALSKTFQEAIIVVRNLGYKYIWIDSLCIIQDSREDWGHESEFMGGIYRNSICTIAATASKDGDCGCFRLRNTLRSGPCQLWGNELHRICVDIENDTVDRRYRREVNGGPLNTRAWVLQERVLSPRIIHYSESTVYWDCREAHFLDSGRSISDERSLSLGFEGGDARLFDTTSSTFKKDFSDHWKFSVEKYCEMKLTVESDRLIAFMGITKYVEEATGNQKCKFGLWTHYLLEHMLWRIQDASSISTIGRTTSEIPSWSWASHHGHIRYFPPNKEDTATTFWYPESEGGWKRDAPLDIDDPSLVENIVADISRQMELGVDPETGYLSNKVYCSTVIEECSSERLVCLSGKLNVTSGAVMILRDAFQAEEETAIMNSLRIGDNSVGYRRLVCIWLDYPMNPLPIDLVYLRIYVQGAQRPKVERFLNLSGSNGWDGTNKTLLAPYALHTIGLILLPTGQADQYRRVGFFRAIETLGVSPAPHPKGVDPENPFFKNCWFGEDCATRKLMIV